MKTRDIINKDLHRYGKKYHFWNMPPQLKFLIVLRKASSSKSLFKLLHKCKLNRLRIKTGNEIFSRCKIGYGLYLGHIGPRYIHETAIIGNNCNINQNVTIGQENRGPRKGVPTIGNNVWIGANAIIVGKIYIGDDVLIAPGAFVNFDVPAHSLVLGNPAIIKHKDNATEHYINNIAQ